MDILERVAVERFHAKTITLDTVAYHVECSPDGTRYEEDFLRPGKSLPFYYRRGYKQYRVRRLYILLRRLSYLRIAKSAKVPSPPP
jgi:hypothetical protein